MERAGKVLLGFTLVAVMAGGCYNAATAHAGACEPRSAAHVAKHGGLAADSAWHVSRGQLPTCGAESSYTASGGGESRDNRSSDSGWESSWEDEGRFCDGRWWC